MKTQRKIFLPIGINSIVKKSSFAICLTVLMMLGLAFAAIPETASASTTGISVNTPSQSEIVRYASEHPTTLNGLDAYGNPTSSYNITYSARPLLSAPYSAGSLSENELTCALNTLKLIRYIAGVPDDVSLNDQYNALAQASCLVNYANNELSHSPAVPSEMDPTLASLGIKGASESNIAWASWQNESIRSTMINGWLYDSDSYNLSVQGHRRWMLNPALSATGFGALSGSRGTYNAMYVFDFNNTDDNYYGVAWPAQNTPVSYFPKDSAWTVSMGRALNSSSIDVTLTRQRDGKVWHFSESSANGDFYVSNLNCGQKGCIIFRPSGLGECKQDDCFDVQITGDNLNVQYQVNFFDMENYYSPASPQSITVSLNSNNKPTIDWQNTEDADYYQVYRKASGGKWKLIADKVYNNSYDDASTGAGIKYYYAVTSCKTIDQTTYVSEKSSAKSVSTVLNAPKLTSAQATAKHTNYIKWSSSSKASGYKVYRRIYGKTTWKLMITTSKLYYKDTSAKSGVKYEYRVKAYRSMYSNKVYSKYSTLKAVRTR